MFYTFDIFDTLLTRRFYNHLGIFAYMQHVLRREYAAYGLPMDFARDFFTIRKYADTEAHSHLGREATFTEIYDFIRMYSGIGEDAAQKLMQLEIAAEVEFCEPISENIAAAESYLDAGHTVVMLSDMYHSQETLRRLVTKLSPRLGRCDVMVSAHDGGGKGSGKLFRSCMERYGLAPDRICHFGDHAYADHDMPRSLGISAVPRFQKADRNYYANYLHRCDEENVYLDQYIGTSRLCDLNNNLGEAAKIGCYIAGPMLYAFVEWVLKTALERSKKDLFFLARDGLVLLEIARKIAAAKGYPINLHYLRISRLAAYRCGIFSDYTPALLDFAFLCGEGGTLRDIAERLQLPLALLRERFAEKGLRLEEATPLATGEMEQARRILADAPELRGLSRAASARERKALLSYLESVNFSFSNATLVDVGWKGSIQDVLYDIAGHEHIPADITGLYFGVCVRTDRQNAASKKYGYLIEPHRLERRTWLHDGVLVFLEIFCHHCEHGTVTGYAFENEVAVPQSDPVYAGNRDFLEELHKGVHLFVDKMLESASEDADTSRFIGYYLRLLQEPDRAMADCLGQYRHLPGVHDDESKEIVPHISLMTLLKHALSGKRLPMHWVEGSVARKHGLGTRAYFFYHRHKSRLRRIRLFVLRLGRLFKNRL
jgi:FMN phosphatase YigB (HAD superfamily)